jgi:hypothetical protein
VKEQTLARIGTLLWLCVLIRGCQSFSIASPGTETLHLLLLSSSLMTLSAAGSSEARLFPFGILFRLMLN